jgi:hypothetical protein
VLRVMEAPEPCQLHHYRHLAEAGPLPAETTELALQPDPLQGHRRLASAGDPKAVTIDPVLAQGPSALHRRQASQGSQAHRLSLAVPLDRNDLDRVLPAGQLAKAGCPQAWRPTPSQTY